MVRVALPPAQRDDLRTRGRIERVRRSAAGGTAPRIAARLGRHEQTVREYGTAFLADGFAAPAAPRASPTGTPTRRTA